MKKEKRKFGEPVLFTKMITWWSRQKLQYNKFIVRENMNAIKKVSLSVTALAFSAVAFAGPDLDTRVQNLEKDMHEVKTKTVTGTMGAKTALARPEVEGAGYFVSFDILYWHAKVGGTEYAYSSINQGPVSLPVDARVREIEFAWDWGFRVGIGANFVHGGWDLLADYTYFKTDGNSNVTSGTGAVVVPNQGDGRIISEFDALGYTTALTYVNKATSQYSVDFDRINFELGRNYFISHNLSFRPHFGLATAWINQKQTTRYTGGQIGVNTVQVKNKCDFWGLGPMTGLQSKWYLTNGFSVFGNASGALLYGYYQVQMKNWYSADPVKCTALVRGNMHRFAPTTQLQIGLAYDKYISNDKQHIGVSLGYDCQYWWSMNQSFWVNPAVSAQYQRQNESVSFHGVDLHIRWDF